MEHHRDKEVCSRLEERRNRLLVNPILLVGHHCRSHLGVHHKLVVEAMLADCHRVVVGKHPAEVDTLVEVDSQVKEGNVQELEASLLGSKPEVNRAASGSTLVLLERVP